MKKLTTIRLSAALFIGAMIVSACGGNNGSDADKANPENEVRAFGKNFVEKLSANQLDSLKAAYPDIVNADSIAPIQSDTIIVVETAPGQYDMTLAEGVTLKVNRAEDGNVSVTESKGLFVFPADKVDIAKKTGMWNDSLNDARLNERMKNEDFFKFVKDLLKNKTKNIITVGKYVDTSASMGGNGRFGYNTLKNNTDVDIDASDYSIVYYEFDFDIEEYKTRPGKPIPAHGSIKLESSGGTMFGEYFEKIKWKLSEEKKAEKFAAYTGNEYQEYLNSKK